MGTFQRTFHAKLHILLRTALGFHLKFLYSSVKVSVVVCHTLCIQANDTSGGLWDAVIT
jgi:hypothetical protein